MDFIDFLVVVLPTAIALLSVLVSIKLTRGESHKVWWGITIALGVGASALTWVSQSNARKSHQQEVARQQKDVEGIKDQLQKSELQRVSDTKYLEGKLDVFAQFAPAIVKLAQATEENTRKQYETKKLSNKELRDFTLKLVARMREFDKPYQIQFNNLSLKYRNAWNDPTERQKEEVEFIAIHTEYDRQFRNNFLADAVFCRDQLRAKLNMPPENRILPLRSVDYWLDQRQLQRLPIIWSRC